MGKEFVRRRQYIIKKEFQLKYVGLFLTAMLASALITGYTIYYNSWAILGEKLANVYPQGRLMAIFQSVNIRVAVNLVFIAIICAGIGILVSHKIAGPVYRMIKFFDALASGGDYGQRIRLRKGDELKDLAASINRFMERLDKEKKS